MSIKYVYHNNAWAELYVRAAGGQRKLSQRDIDDDRINDNGTPGWATVNLRFFYRFNNMSLNLNFENLADYKYKEHGSGIYSSGRNISLALKYQQ